MSVVVSQFSITADTGVDNIEYAPPGYKVIGVGWKVESPYRGDIIVTHWPTPDAGGWNFVMDNIENTTISAQMDVWLVCSDSV